MKFLTMAAVLILLLLNGCAQTGPKTTENATATAQPIDTTGTVEAMLEQARAFRKANPGLFNDASGVLITGLVPGGQGEQIGLMPGDILLTYDGNALQTKEHFIQTYIEKKQISITLTYLRDDEKREAVLQGGEIGIQIASLIPSTSEEIEQIIYKGTGAYYQSHFQEALQLYQQALNQSRENDYKKGEADSLHNLGNVYRLLGQYSQAIEHHEASLKIKHEIGDRWGEVTSLNSLVYIYEVLFQYPEALEKRAALLRILQEINNPPAWINSAIILRGLCDGYSTLSQYSRAIDCLQEALLFNHKIDNQSNVAENHLDLGSVHLQLSHYPQAIEHFEKSLAINRKIGNKLGESANLLLLAQVYSILNQHHKFIEFSEKSWMILRKEIEHRQDLASNPGNLNNMIDSSRFELFENFLKIIREEVNNQQGTISDPWKPHREYNSSNFYMQAIELFEKTSTISYLVADPLVEVRYLYHLGLLYFSAEQYLKAFELFEKSLTIIRKIGSSHYEAIILTDLGWVNFKLEQYQKSLKYTQQALTIMKQANVSDSMWTPWYCLFNILQKLGHHDAAILTGKQVINILQNIRSRNVILEKNLQDSFIKDKVHIYHNLAGLLIEQGRLIEAEQVMAMLKEEEYFNYIRRDSREDNRTTRAEYTAAEKPIAAELDRFGADLVTLGRDWEELDKQAKTDEQAKARLDSVEKQLRKAQQAFLGALTQLENYFVERQGKDAVEFGKRQLKNLETQKKMLRKHQAVIITTVTTKEKLYLLLTTPQVQLVRQSPIGAKEFNLLLEKLRNTLRHPKSDLAGLKQQAQALYVHLVKPLEHDLQQSGAKTLMWSLDGALRYIPMTVLHDGNRYLVEQYGMSLFTAASHSDWQEHAHESWRAAGLGVSHAIGEFSPLPSVPDELRSIIREREGSSNGVLPGEIHLNEAFNLDAFKSVIRARYPVLHLASHFKLRSDNDASELLLGDGSLLKMSEFKESPAFMMQVDLLTLSACDTASGGEGSGGEVESFAVLAQLRGAGGVLASLWRVEDASTAQLMRRFYQLRNEDPNISKAEALRQAQIALINGSIHSNDHDYRHPFFWAPFVMMGNWL